MPQVSVILAAYYSGATLGDCLRALRRQSFRDFEAIVVNSSAEERTAAVAAAFPEVHFIQHSTRLLPHAARNLGVERATGELLVFSDADCAADADWLQYLVEAWKSGRAVVGGAMDVASQRWFEQGVHICKFHGLLKGQAPGPRWILPTANVAYARRVWDQIGPFNGEVFAGDAILSWQAKAGGFTPWFEPRAIVAHRHEGNVRGFLRQRISRGAEFGAVRADYEGWSKARLIASLPGTPLLIFSVLSRAALDAARGSCLGRYLWTFPLQIAGHGWWGAGEVRGYWTALTKPRPPSVNRGSSAQGLAKPLP
jgi:glycosyltransferase involved in cell wall biosynthesis